MLLLTINLAVSFPLSMFKSIIVANERFVFTLNPGHKMNYHSHEKRDEVWTVISGTGTAIVDGVEQLVKPGDVVTMEAGCKHTIIAGDAGLQLYRSTAWNGDQCG